MVENKDIRLLSLAEIEAFLREKNEKPFRARQVYDWLWKKTCRSFDEMTNLSKETRQLLEENFSFPVLQLGVWCSASKDNVQAQFIL